MRITSRVVVGSPTFRLVSLMVLTLLLAVIAGGAVVAGASLLPSVQTRLVAPPYGAARNGSIAYELGGDIYLADANGNNSHVIIAGPDMDVAPWFSQDGARSRVYPRSGGPGGADGGECRRQRPERRRESSLVHGLHARWHRRWWGPEWSMGNDVYPSWTSPQAWLGDMPLGRRRAERRGARSSRDRRMAGRGDLHRLADPGQSDKGIYAVSTDGSGLPRLIGELATSEAHPESGTLRDARRRRLHLLPGHAGLTRRNDGRLLELGAERASWRRPWADRAPRRSDERRKSSRSPSAVESLAWRPPPVPA